MMKPLRIEVGQIWHCQYDDIDYVARVIRTGFSFCDIKIIKSIGNPIRVVGNLRTYSFSTLFHDDRWSYEFLNGKKFSNRKRPQNFIVICRGCGKTFNWIIGTSKRNYLCIPCRRSYEKA